jgi:uncharacterized OB-fold protein
MNPHTEDSEDPRMDDTLHDVEPMVYQSRINVPYSWWAGDTASRFFKSLRDEKKIIAKKCHRCNRVYVPPRKVCPLCFTENPEWVEVSDEGVLQSYTISRRQLAIGMRVKARFADERAGGIRDIVHFRPAR